MFGRRFGFNAAPHHKTLFVRSTSYWDSVGVFRLHSALIARTTMPGYSLTQATRPTPSLARCIFISMDHQQFSTITINTLSFITNPLPTLFLSLRAPQPRGPDTDALVYTSYFSKFRFTCLLFLIPAFHPDSSSVLSSQFPGC